MYISTSKYYHEFPSVGRIVLKTSLKEYKHVTLNTCNIYFCHYSKLIIFNLGSKTHDYSINTLNKNNKIIAYNSNKKILTFLIDAFLHDNINNKKYKVKNGLLSLFLTPGGVEYIKNTILKWESRNKKLEIPCIKYHDKSFEQFYDYAHSYEILKELFLCPFTDKKYIKINNEYLNKIKKKNQIS